MEEFIQRLQLMPERIRNVTIVAHIDHGKTTLADTLLATNDFINRQQQGKARLLDFLPIEQERLITVKSSSVSLVHLSTNWKVVELHEKQKVPFLIQLFDSPGHCDFSQEVLSSISICDGAILLIDAVEGVRSQTFSVVKQLLQLNLDMVLCINKIDRLFEELLLSSYEVFYKVLEIIADVNGIIRNIRNSSDEYFSLSRNVLIACAYSGWGVSLSSTVHMLKRSYPGFSKHSDEELVGYFAQSDSYMTASGAIKTGKSEKSLFITFILEPIMRVFNLTKTQEDYAKNTAKLSQLLKILNGHDKELEGHFTTNVQYRDAFLQQTYPLGTQIMDLVVLNVRPPPQSQNHFVARINKKIAQKFSFVGLVGKFLTNIDVDEPMTHSARAPQSRNFSLMRIVKQLQGNQLYIGERAEYYSSNGTRFHIVGLFQPLGKLFRMVTYQQLCEGNIIGIETDVQVPNNSLVVARQTSCQPEQSDDGMCKFVVTGSRVSDSRVESQQVDEQVLRQTDRQFCAIQGKLLDMQKPLVKVCILPDKIQNYNALYESVARYCAQEMSVEVELSKLGDIILVVCGDVHLDLCMENIQQLVDFEVRIANVHLQLYETFISPEKCDTALEKPDQFDLAIAEYEHDVENFQEDDEGCDRILNMPHLTNAQQQLIMPTYYYTIGRQCPIRGSYGTEILIKADDSTMEKLKLFVSASLGDQDINLFNETADSNGNTLYVQRDVPQLLKLVLEKAFAQNMEEGPLCLEQMRDCELYITCSTPARMPISWEGVCSEMPHFFVRVEELYSSLLNDVTGLLRCFLQAQNLRIIEPFFQVQITAQQDNLQGINKVLERIRGQDVRYDCKVNYSELVLQASAYIPQEYGLTVGRLIRSETSGYGQVEFLSSTYILNQEDPRHVNKALSEDEVIEFGQYGRNKATDQKAVRNNVKIIGGSAEVGQDFGANVARRVVNRVLRQKGLYIGEIVEDAEKQRTIKRAR